jgi:hypothetical protein
MNPKCPRCIDLTIASLLIFGSGAIPALLRLAVRQSATELFSTTISAANATMIKKFIQMNARVRRCKYSFIFMELPTYVLTALVSLDRHTSETELRRNKA